MESDFKLTRQHSLELEAYLQGMSKLGWHLVHLQLVNSTDNNTWAILHSKGQFSNFAAQQGLKDGK